MDGESQQESMKLRNVYTPYCTQTPYAPPPTHTPPIDTHHKLASSTNQTVTKPKKNNTDPELTEKKTFTSHQDCTSYDIV